MNFKAMYGTIWRENVYYIFHVYINNFIFIIKHNLSEHYKT